MNDSSNWLLYGATGYTGELIARHVAATGCRPVLAGRNEAAIRQLAEELSCPHRVFSLDDRATLPGHLAGAALVLNCAGPFSRTAGPMMEACLQAGASYLDITGEINVIEAAHALHAQAERAGVTLMPAVGFDVVPTDCLAGLLNQRLPGGRLLQLAFAFTGGMSRGTAKTMLEALPQGGRARIDGRIETVPVAWKQQLIPFADRARWAMTIPWGDVASAFYTTGIPNIEVYLATPRAQIRIARWSRPLVKLLASGPMGALARQLIDRRAPGPDQAARQRERSQLWGRVTDAQGRSAAATLQTMSGYELTIHTAAAAVERVRAGVAKGFQTPARAFGANFILDFSDTQLDWLPTG